MLVINNFKIVHSTGTAGDPDGGGVCLIGTVAGRGEIQTSNITNISPCGKMLKTENGTMYQLGTPAVGMWGLQLQMRRPVRYARLMKNNCHGL